MAASPLDSASPTRPDAAAEARHGPRQVLRLDRDGAWRASAGYFDVFVVIEQGGRRHHLFRCEAGALMVGCVWPTDTGASLIAVGSLDSAVAPAPLPSAPELEAWVGRLAAAAGTRAQLPELVAAPGDQTLEPRGLLHAHPRRLLWLKVTEGAVELLDGTVLAPGEGPIPFVGLTFVMSELGARVSLLAQAPAAEAARRGALVFQRAALEWIAIRILKDEALSSRRARERAKATDAELARAFDALGRVAGAPAEARRAPMDPMVCALEQLLGEIGARSLGVAGPDAGDAAEPIQERLARRHLQTREVVLREGWEKREGPPLLGWRASDRLPVALLPFRNGWRAVGLDLDVRVTAANAADFAPDAIQIYRQLPRRPIGFLELASFGRRRLQSDLARLILAGFATSLLALAAPAASALLFDRVVPAANLGQLWSIVIGLCALAVGMAVFELVKSIALLRMEARLDSRLQAALVDRLLSMPAQFFRGFSTGDLTDRALGFQGVRQALMGNALAGLLGAVFASVSFGLMLLYGARLALVGLATLAVAVVLQGLIAYLQLRREREHVQRQGRLDGFVLQLLVGIAKLRAAGAERRAMAQWAHRYAEQKRRFLAARRWAGWGRVIEAGAPTLAFVVLYAAIVGFAREDAAREPLKALATGGGAGDLQSLVTTGGFIAFAAAFGQLLAAFGAMTQALGGVLGAMPLLERARPILATSPQIADEAPSVAPLAGAVELRKVSFRYSSDGPLVLNELDLSAPAGSYIAIVGPSGSGKSTIMRLLLGFERQESGEVFFDGRAAERFDPSALRRQMGVVLQHARITDGSIFENIVGASGLGVQEAWAAARLVGMDRDIESMPMGMHTILLDGGGTLSGGQRQRLIIARALVRRPRILLLDEATSALDNRTQAVVSETLAKLSVTRIVIAHRLSTIRGADRIFVLDHGRAADFGAFDELMARSPLFQRLVRRQLL